MATPDDSTAYWDRHYTGGGPTSEDAWALPLLPPPPARVLDAGCGEGVGTALLSSWGYRVTAFDSSPVAAGQTASRGIETLCCDLGQAPRVLASRAPFDAVLADLVLHYLPWEDTVTATAGLASLLSPSGPLVFRVNSTEDTGFGAGQGELLEPGLFLEPAAGIPKRFFSETDVRRLFSEAGLCLVSLSPAVTCKFSGREKHVWQGAARRCRPGDGDLLYLRT